METGRFTPDGIFESITTHSSNESVLIERAEAVGIQLGTHLYDIPQPQIMLAAEDKALAQFARERAPWYVQKRKIANNPMEFARALKLKTSSVVERMLEDKYGENVFDFHSGIIRGFAGKAIDSRDFPPAIFILRHMFGPSMLKDPDIVSRIVESTANDQRLRLLVAYQISEALNEE